MNGTNQKRERESIRFTLIQKWLDQARDTMSDDENFDKMRTELYSIMNDSPYMNDPNVDLRSILVHYSRRMGVSLDYTGTVSSDDDYRIKKQMELVGLAV